MKKLQITIFALIAVLGCALTVQAAPAKKVAVVPFSVNAEKDMTFLQQGIYDMLANRLQTQGVIDVVSKQSSANVATGVDINSVEGRRRIAGKLDADYVVTGVLTVLGNSISVDVTVTAADAKISDRNFSDMSSDMGSIINKMDSIARNIKNYVSAGTTATASQSGNVNVDLPRVADDGPGSRTQSWTDNTGEESRTNPETAFKRDVMSGQTYALLSDNEDAARALLLDFWKGPAITYPMMAIAVGDIDGDGLNETVIAATDTIYVYRMINNNFVNVTSIPLEGSAKVVAMDIADVNRSGIPQIILTRLNVTRQGLSSTVLEYRNGKYEVIADKLSYWMRVAKLPSRGPVLLSQKHKLGSPFQRNLVELTWDGNKYVEEDSRWRTGWPVNSIGSMVGEMQGEYWVVGYDDTDHLRVFNDKGGQIWESGGRRGGTPVIYEMPKRDSGNIDNAYLPARVDMRYMRNSPNQLVVSVNEDAMGRMLANTRGYSDCMIYGYTWNGIDMDLAWKTRKIRGFARDFIVADFDNDGQMELVMLLVQSEGDSILTDPRGFLIAYELPPEN